MKTDTKTETQSVVNSFCWAELGAGDLARAQKFYDDLYAWNFQEMETPNGPYIVVDAGNGHGGGIMPGVPGQSPTWMPYVHVRNLEETIAKVEAASGAAIFPPTSLSDGGRIAWVQDHERITLGLHEAGGAPLPEVALDAAGAPHFSFFERAVRDLDAAKQFYGEVFDWSFEDSECLGQPYVLINTGSTPSGGFGLHNELTPCGWLAYLRVQDLDTAMSAAVAVGASTVIERTSMGDGDFAVYRDLEGARMGLYQPAG